MSYQIGVGDTVMDKITLRVYGRPHFGEVHEVNTLRNGTRILQVIWADDETRSPEGTYDEEVILVQRYCKYHDLFECWFCHKS